MPLPVASLYASLLTLVYIAIFANVGRARNKAQVSLGDGGDPDLLVAMRAQANFIENVPLALLLLALIELDGAPHWWLHVLGLALLAARIAHPLGLDPANPRKLARGFGAAVTALVLLAAAATALWAVVRWV